VNYQQLPGHQTDTPAGPPPGWYRDPGGLEAVRWWDGTRWSPHTQPLPGTRQEPQPPYPNVSAPGSDGFDAFRPESTGRHRRQSEPWDDAGHASFSPAQPDPAQQQEPQARPDQQTDVPQQQPYAPGPQPQAQRTPRRPGGRKTRRALIGLGALIGIVVAISVATTHNSPSAGNVAATSTTSAAAAAVASASPPDCNSQAISWRDNGGLSQLEAVVTDMGDVQSAGTALGTDLSAGADASQDEASLQTAAASLQSDSQTAQANPPPSCIPNLRADEGAALNDASKAALDCQNAVSEVGSGNYSVATDDMNAANTAISASGSKFQDATSDVQAFNNG
jgi:Protein of unknown function (DUF2510)